TGAPLAPKPRIEGGVTTATPDDAGGWYLRGDALTIAGAERHGVVHLRRDGSLDHAFRLVSNGSIDSLARVGTTLYVGGSFTSLNGSDRTALAAVDTRTGEMLPWQPRLSLTADVDPDVSTVAVSGDGKTIYFAGDFERVGKKRRASV